MSGEEGGFPEESGARTKLEEFFNLDSAIPSKAGTEGVDAGADTEPAGMSLSDVIGSVPVSGEVMERLADAATTIGRIEAALPQVEDIAGADKSYDDCRDRALAMFVKVATLLENVEDAQIAPVANAANAALKTAVDATSAKVDRKIRMVGLQVQQERLSLEGRKVGLAERKLEMESGGAKALPGDPVKTTARAVSRSDLLSGGGT